jgi:hypothetical protein
MRQTTACKNLLYAKTVLLISAFLPVNGLAQTPAPVERPLAINLAGVRDWSTAWAFVDRMKYARTWIPFNADGSGGWDSGVSVATDAFGYPLKIPYDPDGSGPVPPQAVRTLVFRSVDTYPAGSYTLIFEGTGTITLNFDAQGVFSESDVPHSFEIASPSNSGLLVTITSSSENDPIRNIRIIMPGFAHNYETQIFHPLFLERLAGFKVVRFMDWGSTNHSPVQSWSDRTTPQHFSQAREQGVAPEYMIALANRLGADPWFCIPHQADDNYVRQLARLTVQNLNSARKVYVEYSNEVWNGIFAQSAYVQDRGEALGLSSNRYQAGLFYNSRRSAEIFKIFEEEFGGTNRLVRVIASQAASSWTGEQVLHGLSSSTINPTSARADVLAIAPYFGGSIANEIADNGEVASITIDKILDRAEAAVDSQTKAWTISNKNTADQYSVPLITYEGGQHLVGTGANQNNQELTDKLIAANRHQRMKNIYLKMFDVWFQNGGSLFAVFSNVGSPSKYGSWGILEYQSQPVSEAPKYAAVREILDSSTGDGTKPLHPVNLRIEQQ